MAGAMAERRVGMGAVILKTMGELGGAKLALLFVKTYSGKQL